MIIGLVIIEMEKVLTRNKTKESGTGSLRNHFMIVRGRGDGSSPSNELGYFAMLYG